MSEDTKVVRKRGRPKKVAEIETIVVINSSADSAPEAQSAKSKKATGRKSAVSSSEILTNSRRRIPKQTIVDGVAEVDIPKSTRTRRSAKITDTITPSLENVIAARPSNSDQAGSSILRQAIAFKEENLSNLKVLEGQPDQIAHKTSTERSGQSDSEAPIQDPLVLPSSTSLLLNQLESQLHQSSSSIRQSSIARIELSASRFTTNLKQSSELLSILQSELHRRANLAIGIHQVHQQLTNAENTIHDYFAEIRQTQYSRSNTRIQNINNHLNTLSHNIQQLASLTTTHHRSNIIQSLESNSSILSLNLHNLATHLQTMKAPQSTNPTPPSSSTSTTTTPKPAQQQTHLPQPPPPSPKPVPLRPTQQPYETLRRTPEFKRQSRKWTGLIVGIPVLIATSVVLFKKHQDTLMKRRSEEEPARARGELPRGIGVGRDSNVGVNGGV